MNELVIQSPCVLKLECLIFDGSLNEGISKPRIGIRDGGSQCLVYLIKIHLKLIDLRDLCRILLEFSATSIKLFH